MNVGFFCRGGEDVGYGHLSRSASLARGFLDAGHCVRFCYSGAWPDFIEARFERAATEKALLDWSDIVICDGVRAEQLKIAVSPPVLIVQVDDSGGSGVGARVIINPNLYGARVRYPEDQIIFGGPEYNLIPPALFLQDENTTERHGIVIGFGGSDFGQYGFATANALADLADEITVLLACAEHQCDIEALNALRQRGVDVCFGESLPQFLKECELYVGAAGVTSLEALAAGCKMAVCSIVDNQDANVAKLREEGYPALYGFDPLALAELASRGLAEDTPRPSLLAASGIPRVVQLLASLQQELRGEGV